MSQPGPSTEFQTHGIRTPEGTVFDPEAPPVSEASPIEVEAVERDQRALLVKVYTYIVVGLMISGAVAHFAMGKPETIEYVHGHSIGFQALFLLEIVAVAIISQAIEKLPIVLTAIVFVAYAVLNGVSFAVFFLFIPPDAVAVGFLVAALTFAAMAVYGHRTGADLGGLRSMIIMLAVGVGVMAAVNLVFKNDLVYWATSYVGVMIFTSLASYHAEDFRDFDFEFEDDDEANHKAALTGALLLYLDVVNLYIMATRLVGAGKSRR